MADKLILLPVFAEDTNNCKNYQSKGCSGKEEPRESSTDKNRRKDGDSETNKFQRSDDHHPRVLKEMTM